MDLCRQVKTGLNVMSSTCKRWTGISFSNKLGSYQDGDGHKIKPQGFFHRGRQSPGKDICIAKQSNFSQWRAVTQEGAGQPKIQPPPATKSSECLELGFPSQGERAREPVAGPISQSYDSHRGQLGGKVAWDTLT